MKCDKCKIDYSSCELNTIEFKRYEDRELCNQCRRRILFLIDTNEGKENE